MHTPFPIWNQSVVPCLVLTVASWPAYRFNRRQVRWSGIFVSLRIFQGGRERWRRNRTGRPLSPSQIPQKNTSTPSKLHKTTSVGWQRTSGNQKSRPLSSKTGRKKYKRRERRQRRWGGSSVPGREARPGKGILRREVSKHQETLSLPSLWRALETQRAT